MKFLLALALVLASGACGQSPSATSTVTTTIASVTAPSKPEATTNAAASDGSPAPVWDPASARSWDRDLLALMPQIDACLAQSPELRMISYAGRDQEGVLVVMHGEEAFDCRVSDNRVQITPQTSHAPGDGDAEFIRGPGPNPGGECYVAPEVRDASGNVLGWMIDPEGC